MEFGDFRSRCMKMENKTPRAMAMAMLMCVRDCPVQSLSKVDTKRLFRIAYHC